MKWFTTVIEIQCLAKTVMRNSRDINQVSISISKYNLKGRVTFDKNVCIGQITNWQVVAKLRKQEKYNF